MSTIPELIAAHCAAWEAFQVAPDDKAQEAEDAVHHALDELLFTPVGSHNDVEALLLHLDWYASPDGEGPHAEQHPLAMRAALHCAMAGAKP